MLCDLKGNLINGIVNEYSNDGSLRISKIYKEGKYMGAKLYNNDGSWGEVPANIKKDTVIKDYRMDGSLKRETPIFLK